MNRVYLGLGGNLGDVAATIDKVIIQMRQLPGVSGVVLSPKYKSAPIGYLAQPEFINAVACLETRLSAPALLALMKSLEKLAGRAPSFPNGPRVLDLDILLFNDEVIMEEGLTIPHPRMHERAFVMRPLADLNPNLDIPGLGALSNWLARCSEQPLQCLSARS